MRNQVIMIKLIASDLDGTLLRNGAQSLDPRVFTLIDRLYGKGILFVAASGRQYANMKRMFLPVWKKMIFVCENGGIAMYRDTLVSQSVIPREIVLKLSRDILSQKDCELQLSGQQSVYLLPKRKEFAEHLIYTVKNTVTVLDDLGKVNEEIVKVSAFVKNDGASEMARYFSPWSEHLNVAVSGREWVDFGIATKGTAIQLIQEAFDLNPSEMMAFGDNFNDEQMFSAVEHSYSMNHAAEAVRQMSRYHCDNVEPVLEELLERQDAIAAEQSPVRKLRDWLY
jgi:Cof subfamily protein (haloacid dehalogenase superfamily)